jgi:hypothetical protein
MMNELGMSSTFFALIEKHAFALTLENYLLSIDSDNFKLFGSNEPHLDLQYFMFNSIIVLVSTFQYFYVACYKKLTKRAEKTLSSRKKRG